MKDPKTQFVVCVRSEPGADVELRKVYRVLPDEAADGLGCLRVVDETDEDYLYPRECFAAVELAEDTARLFSAAAERP
jgi:hypothetical protein